ncbi:hypothetical protein ACNKHL_05755 [Shigella flexneri]
MQAAQARSDAGNAYRQVITDKPIIRNPGCPPKIPDVMSAIITYMVTFESLARCRQNGPSADVLWSANPR